MAWTFLDTEKHPANEHCAISNQDLVLTNFERGAHTMILIGGGFVATTDEALLCAFAMHPFDDQPGVRRRLARRVWRRARAHGQSSRYARGEALVDLAAVALRDYYNFAAEAGETAYMERCINVLSAAKFDGDRNRTQTFLTLGLQHRHATRVQHRAAVGSLQLSSI